PPRPAQPPQRNQQLAGQGDDPDPPHPAAPVPEAGLAPARQGTLGLPAQPRPRDLDRHRPHEPVPGLRNPLFALQVATLIRRGCEPGEAADFAPVGKLPPAEELHHVEPGALQADRPQGEQLPDLPDRRIGARVQALPTLALEGPDLPGPLEDLLPFALQAPGPGGPARPPAPRAHGWAF